MQRRVSVWGSAGMRSSHCGGFGQFSRNSLMKHDWVALRSFKGTVLPGREKAWRDRVGAGIRY